MRVIAGIAKGHRIKTLKGELTRPTGAKVKEAMFSILQPYISDSVVLDLFAGSGALGIEALSRGCKHCDFVEQNKSAAKIIAENLEKTHFLNCKIYNSSARSFLNNCTQKYDLVFIDPPYSKDLYNETLSALNDMDMLNPNAIVVCETGLTHNIKCELNLFKQSKYKDTMLLFFKKDETM
ncbi:MAG: 16S rRNA (guanine(966)-N(2))-methyltransferase RsmD [Clostridiaceae bacterium]|nr:16S rRNA (guanine(966)-N(2))-methyltransferase RsmD [Clostridiaceae bacterium]